MAGCFRVAVSHISVILGTIIFTRQVSELRGQCLRSGGVRINFWIVPHQSLNLSQGQMWIPVLWSQLTQLLEH